MVQPRSQQDQERNENVPYFFDEPLENFQQTIHFTKLNASDLQNHLFCIHGEDAAFSKPILMLWFENANSPQGATLRRNFSTLVFVFDSTLVSTRSNSLLSLDSQVHQNLSCTSRSLS